MKHNYLNCLKIILFTLLHCAVAHAQKLPFENFSVDRGLFQSQVLSITQDNQHHLWIGTYAGVDRFDGSSFTHHNRSNGLSANSVTALYTAANGTIWMSTFKGINSYNGLAFTNFAVDNDKGHLTISALAEDDSGVLWAFDITKGLFRQQQNRFVRPALPEEKAVATCLFKNDAGQLLVYFYKKGIYSWQHNQWKKFIDLPHDIAGEYILSIAEYNNTYYVASSKQRLFKIADGKILATTTVPANYITAGCADGDGNFWVGTDRGLQVFDQSLTIKFTGTATTGLTDNIITELFKDVEGNMWIGSDGDGLFKFSGSLFKKYDKYTGLAGNIIMGFASGHNGDFYIASREGGLTKYNPSTKIITPVSYTAFSKNGINCMSGSPNGTIYLCTMDKRLLQYDGSSFKEIRLEPTFLPFVNTIVAKDNTVWFSTSAGCYYMRNAVSKRIEGLNEITVGLLPLENEETLIGTSNGLYSYKENRITKLTEPELKEADILCLQQYKEYILIGTADQGILLWDRQHKKFYTCNTQSGLTDNQIFAFYIDRKNRIWTGTTTGIQQVLFNEPSKTFTVKSFTQAEGYESSETNLNAILEDDSSNIWIGTTKGAFVFADTVITKPSTAPYIVIQKVQSPGIPAKNTLSPWYQLPELPTLSYRNNSISFTVKGIALNNPGAVLYSYKLEGYDTAFSSPSPQSFFNYQNLEPGNYIFQVKAYAANGMVSHNNAAYAFSVATPFHKATWFIVLIIVALILLGVLLQLFFSKMKIQKQTEFENLRKEEQHKIRQRTSEDFHDELGNKLTRIALLTDILERQQNNAEATPIIRQIKENVSALYDGTKEVIWSLSQDSDNLKEVLKRIEQFGTTLFSDTDIEFSYTGIEQVADDITLPISYSRNMLMIAKELLNNSLRHSACTKASVTIVAASDKEVTIVFADNGKGFDSSNPPKGNGLNNMQQRAERLGGVLRLSSAEGSGTTFRLHFKIPPSGGL